MKKPIYNIFTLAARNLILSLALVSVIQAQGADGEVTTGELSVEALEGLKLQIVSPMTSGAETLTDNYALERYFVIDGSNVIVHLNGLAKGQHRLTVKMQYGTQVEVLAIFDLVVPANLAAGDDEREVQISAVETIGDGSGVQITVDQEVIEGSTNPVAGGAVYGALANTQPAGTYADGAVYTVGTSQSGEEGSEVELSGVAKVLGAAVELSNGATATGSHAVAEGSGTIASGDNSHAEGRIKTTFPGGPTYPTTASGIASHAEGKGTNASGDNSHAEGDGTTASGENSHAEGYETTASGLYSHAEGFGTNASGENSHAEGYETTASGLYSHAEGFGTNASGDNSHAEGFGTNASGDNSHAEGDGTNASGDNSHAEGHETAASGANSHAEGLGTIASQVNQHVCGKYNVEDTDGDYALIVGNGADDENRSNAFAIDWNGNLVLFNSGTPVVLTPAKLAQLIA